MTIWLARFRYSIISSVIPRWPPETCRFSLQAGSNFFPRRICQRYPIVSLFLRWCFERSPFSFHSQIREAMGSYYPEGERPNFFTWIWRKFSAFEDAKKASCKRARHTRQKKEWKRDSIIGQKFESGLILRLYSRHWNIRGLFGQRISGKIEGLHFLLYFWEISCMAPSSQSWDTLFHVQVISLEISIRVSWLQMM